MLNLAATLGRPGGTFAMKRSFLLSLLLFGIAMPAHALCVSESQMRQNRPLILQLEAATGDKTFIPRHAVSHGKKRTVRRQQNRPAPQLATTTPACRSGESVIRWNCG
jgi:hypothetical protein